MSTIFIIHNNEEEEEEWIPPKIEKKKKISSKFKIIRGKPIENLQELINCMSGENISEEQKNFVKSLIKLNDMIGMENLKEQILNQLLFFLQDLQESDMFLHTVLTGPPGSGKCLGIDTPILMFDSSIKMVQNINIGDVIMGDDGTPRNVLSICRGREKMYKIFQTEGIDYIVNESHILSLINENNEVVDISVKDYIKYYINENKSMKGYKANLEFKEINVTDPYTIGKKLYKEIPYEYKFNSKKNQSEILRGISEADSEMFTEKMVEDITFILRCLNNNKPYEINIMELREDDYYGFQIDNNKRFLLGDHTVTHNTTVVNILSEIYSKLGILKTDKIIRADRSSLIGKWLGSTAIKTKEVLKSAKGGVLLLDEVYSLGNKEQGDSFSKECIDTINQYLSEHVDEFICVIAGYKDKVEECFFSYNPGLSRRFPWRFQIDSYKPEDLHKIMKLQLEKTGWIFDENLDINDIILKNTEYFSENGGDTKNFIDKCKIAHARRIFTYEPPIKKRKKNNNEEVTDNKVNNNVITKVITNEDVEMGLKAFIQSKESSKDLKNKYEKIFLSHQMHEKWNKKTNEFNVEILYSSYENFMYQNNYTKNSEKKMLGILEFVDKICKFKGISMSKYKIIIDSNDFFNFLKSCDLISDEVKNYENEENKYEKIFFSYLLHDSWNKKSMSFYNDLLFDNYVQFMNQNKKNILGIVDFLSKICEFKGITQDIYKTKILINTEMLFEYLKENKIVTDVMKNFKNENSIYT